MRPPGHPLPTEWEMLTPQVYREDAVQKRPPAALHNPYEALSSPALPLHLHVAGELASQPVANVNYVYQWEYLG